MSASQKTSISLEVPIDIPESSKTNTNLKNLQLEHVKNNQAGTFTAKAFTGSKSDREEWESNKTQRTIVQEMPTVTTLLQRKKLTLGAEPQIKPSTRRSNQTQLHRNLSLVPPTPVVTKDPIIPVVHIPPVLSTPLSIPTLGTTTPPQFRGTLAVDALDLKSFEKNLKKLHFNSSNLIKLDCLGYFSTHFEEISYFSGVSNDTLQGRLGFGNPTLVSEIANSMIDQATFPSILEATKKQTAFCGSFENLSNQEKNTFQNIGFQKHITIGIFPVYFKKQLQGVWICSSSQHFEFPKKELKVIQKLFLNLKLLSL